MTEFMWMGPRYRLMPIQMCVVLASCAPDAATDSEALGGMRDSNPPISLSTTAIPDPPEIFASQVVRRFGIPDDMPPSDPGLRDPIDAVEWADGSVWILDADWSRIVAYEPGDERGTVIGGVTKRPWSLYQAPLLLSTNRLDSLFLVFYNSDEVYVLNRRGSTVGSIPYDGPQLLSLAYSGGRLVGSHVMDRGTGPLSEWTSDTPGWIRPLSAPDLHALTRSYAVRAPGVVAGATDGRIIHAGAPGVFSIVDARGDVRHVGTPLYGGQPWITLSDFPEPRPTGQSFRLVFSEQHQVLFLWLLEIRNGDFTAEREGDFGMRLFVFSVDGEWLGEVELPSDVSRRSRLMSYRPTNGNLLLVSNEPRKHVVEVRVDLETEES